jgi:hypothetical protein
VSLHSSPPRAAGIQTPPSRHVQGGTGYPKGYSLAGAKSGLGSPSWTLTTIIVVFLTMSSPPFPSPLSSSAPPMPDVYEATSEADLDRAVRERVRARMAELDLGIELLPSSPTGRQEPPSHSQEFSPSQVFNETSSPMPTPTPTGVNPAREAPPTLDPSQVPIGSRPAKKRSLLGHAKLSVFDILNTFRCHWFVSTDHLRTTVLSAQKAKDGKFFLVEFTPQFHAHLVKCAVVLVPHPLHKVKQVMFVYLLELLNREGPLSFFNLAKGQRLATQAQKEKRRLTWRRNRTSRREHRKVAEEAKEGRPQWQCKSCGRKFASRKAVKRHRCPISKGASGPSGPEKGKGKAVNLSQLNKPTPCRPPTPPTPILTPSGPAPPPPFNPPPIPTSAREAMVSHNVRATERGVSLDHTVVTGTSTWRSSRLNTMQKVNERKGLMDSLRDGT